MRYMDDTVVMKRMTKRITANKVWKTLFFLATTFALVTLAVLLYRIVTQGIDYLNIDFLMNFASRFADKAGIKAALIGSLWLMAVVAPVSIILGVGTAIYLEEYAKKNRINDFIRMNISNLAGVPSIVFGLLGLTIFVRMMGLGKSILAAGFTMSLLILPVIIVAAQEAIRAVPNEQREASYGMGATKWQTILRVVLPAAIPYFNRKYFSLVSCHRRNSSTSCYRDSSYPAVLPNGLLSQFTALPMQIYDWAKRPQEAFQYVAAAGILVLMTVLLLMNSIAIYIRNKFQKRY